MFGEKKRKIDLLTSSSEFWKARSIENFEAQQKAKVEHKKTLAELAIVQESYAEKLAKIEEYAGDLLKKDDKIVSLEYELEEASLQNDNLREEAAESSRLLELYRALVASLRIVIKLPAKKSRG